MASSQDKSARKLQEAKEGTQQKTHTTFLSFSVSRLTVIPLPPLAHKLDQDAKEHLAASFQGKLDEKDIQLNVLQSKIDALLMDNNSLEELKEHNRVLQDQVSVLRQQLEAAPAGDSGAPDRTAALEKEIATLRSSLKAAEEGGSEDLSKKLASQKELLQKCKKTIKCVGERPTRRGPRARPPLPAVSSPRRHRLFRFQGRQGEDC